MGEQGVDFKVMLLTLEANWKGNRTFDRNMPVTKFYYENSFFEHRDIHKYICTNPLEILNVESINNN